MEYPYFEKKENRNTHCVVTPQTLQVCGKIHSHRFFWSPLVYRCCRYFSVRHLTVVAGFGIGGPRGSVVRSSTTNISRSSSRCNIVGSGNSRRTSSIVADSSWKYRSMKFSSTDCCIRTSSSRDTVYISNGGVNNNSVGGNSSSSKSTAVTETRTIKGGSKRTIVSRNSTTIRTLATRRNSMSDKACSINARGHKTISEPPDIAGQDNFYAVSMEDHGRVMKIYMPSSSAKEEILPKTIDEQGPHRTTGVSCDGSSSPSSTITTTHKRITNIGADHAASTVTVTSFCENQNLHFPETVVQYQKQLRKMQAAARASAPLHNLQLHILHSDEDIVVVNKPSGVLTVPGIHSNPSILTLLYEKFQNELEPGMKREHMIVHRLDMDTSGIVIFAKTRAAMSNLQSFFRDKKVSKCYEALLCGHIHPDILKGNINLPLQKDHEFPPFMRVATPESERAAKEVVKDLNHAGWKKIIKKNPKPSETIFHVIDREFITMNDASKSRNGEICSDQEGQSHEPYPVTRVRLIPVTGRTHQLRVHCAAIGHPILGDPAYGIFGEASPNGGFAEDVVERLVPSRASLELQLALDKYVKQQGLCMCLHARELMLKHPRSGEDMSFVHPPDF